MNWLIKVRSVFCLELPLPPYHKRKMYHCLQISLTCAKDYVEKERFIVVNKYLSYNLW